MFRIDRAYVDSYIRCFTIKKPFGDWEKLHYTVRLVDVDTGYSEIKTLKDLLERDDIFGVINHEDYVVFHIVSEKEFKLMNLLEFVKLTSASLVEGHLVANCDGVSFNDAFISFYDAFGYCELQCREFAPWFEHVKCGLNYVTSKFDLECVGTVMYFILDASCSNGDSGNRTRAKMFVDFDNNLIHVPIAICNGALIYAHQTYRIKDIAEFTKLLLEE